MNFPLDHIVGEIVRPIIYWIGWGVIFLFTIGQVRPNPRTRRQYLLITLLGVYTACCLPAAAVFVYRSFAA